MARDTIWFKQLAHDYANRNVGQDKGELDRAVILARGRLHRALRLIQEAA